LTSLPEGVRLDRVRLRSLDAIKGSLSPPQQPPGGPISPPSLTNENSMDAAESGSFENKAFDRLIGMMPSPSTPR
jgi:hypothetical protein